MSHSYSYIAWLGKIPYWECLSKQLFGWDVALSDCDFFILFFLSNFISNWSQHSWRVWRSILLKLSIVWLQILCCWNLPQLLFQRKTVSKSSMLALHSVDLISYLISLLSSFFNSACSFLHRGTRAPPEHGKIFIPRKSLLEWVSLISLYITVVLMLKLLLLCPTLALTS